MTIATPLTVSSLKKMKNSVIGNPSVKRQCAQDEAFVQTLVRCLTCEPIQTEPQGSKDDIRIEAAHIISSLSYGSEDALASLLRADALRSLTIALNNIQPMGSCLLKAAFARALRALASSLADIVGPCQWGLSADSSTIRDEAKTALNYLFRIDTLDVYLPLLVDLSTQACSSIALLLGSTIRTEEHRKAVTDWLPLTERVTETKTKRGWEKTSATSTILHRNGGWVARNLARSLVETREYKYQESLLLALAALAKDNPIVASALTKYHQDKNSTLWHVLSLCKTKTPDVQLAACLCATYVIQAHAHVTHTTVDDSAVRTVLSVANSMIHPGSGESIQNRRKACFILYYLVNDDIGVAQIAYQRGSMDRLGALVQSITPLDLNERDEEEPEAVSSLREAALTAVASMSMSDNDIRRAVTDEVKLLPMIEVSLSHRHVGVRYAACQCIRGISRGIAVLRTNLVDTGLGMKVFEIFKKEDEDRRVLSAALSAVCNIVNDFSPLKPVYLDQGLLPRLIQLVECGDPTLRLSALWAIKNVMQRSRFREKQDLVELVGWSRLISLLNDVDAGIQEQSLSLLRNICTDEDSVGLVVGGLGVEYMLELIVQRIKSPNNDVIIQAISLLANMANGRPEDADILLACSGVLPSLQTCLSEPKAEVRRPAAACILQLARTSAKARAGMLELGMDSTLRHMSEWNGGGLTITHGVVGGAREDERDIVEHARKALDFLENARVPYSPL